MSDWRKWLEEMEERAQLLEREAYTVPDAVEARCMVHSHSLPRLIEGYRLLAEAVEAREEYLTLANSPYPTGSEGEALKREYDEEKLIEKAIKCHNAALDHLRGVGRD